MEKNFETIELSLGHLASVSGGDGNTVVITGKDCRTSPPSTDKSTGDTKITVTCREGSVDIHFK